MLVVAVLNFNGADTLRPCLESILAQTRKPDRLVVIDNSSTDGSEKLARELGVEVVHASNEWKYITGLNAALVLSFERLVFLQNDVLLETRFLEVMEREVGDAVDFVAQPQVRDFRGDIDNYGMSLIWPGYGINRKWPHGRDAGYCTSVVFMIDRLAVLRNGFYDPRFAPAYLEDLDYSLRCRRRGTKQLLISEAIAHHMGNHTFSSTYKKKEIVKIIRRNRLKFIAKNYSGVDRLLRLTVAASLDVMKEAVDVITQWWTVPNNGH